MTFFIFLDRLHGGIVMLLVTEKHVVQERALAWQECAGDLKSLSVPEFALELTITLDLRLEVLGAHL